MEIIGIPIPLPPYVYREPVISPVRHTCAKPADIARSQCEKSQPQDVIAEAEVFIEFIKCQDSKVSRGDKLRRKKNIRSTFENHLKVSRSPVPTLLLRKNKTRHFYRIVELEI